LHLAARLKPKAFHPAPPSPTLHASFCALYNGEYVDPDCHFTAKSIGNGTIKITFDKMPEGFKETKSILQIDGTEGKDSNTTNIDITRKP